MDSDIDIHDVFDGNWKFITIIRENIANDEKI